MINYNVWLNNNLSVRYSLIKTKLISLSQTTKIKLPH